MSDPVPIRFVPGWESRRDAHILLPFFVAATGDVDAIGRLCELYGKSLVTDQLLARARASFRLDDKKGYVLGLAPRVCDILLNPRDEAQSTTEQAPVVLKRSMPFRPRPHEVALPAWSLTKTIDILCAPAPITSRPRVSFCGVTCRPALRKAVVERVEAADCIEHRVIHRENFSYPDNQGFLDNIRWAHFVLCPSGVGRFSFRLYETLAAGRVPVFPLNGTTVGPAELMENATIIQTTLPSDMVKAWAGLRLDWGAVHARNRRAFFEYASPLGCMPHLAAAIALRLGTG